jgi:hypothetical protein
MSKVTNQKTISLSLDLLLARIYDLFPSVIRSSTTSKYHRRTNFAPGPPPAAILYSKKKLIILA